MRGGIDHGLLKAWLTARSLSRRVPIPVADRGGWRVDTRNESEICRWVFPSATCDIAELAREIDDPRRIIKLCDDQATLAALLPNGWQASATGFFMRSTGQANGARLPEGYTSNIEGHGPVTEVTILTAEREVAANGFAAETGEAFVYDRIVTEAVHRRRGLGSALMALLRSAKRVQAVPELLVASFDGYALYSGLGWEALSSYSTATLLQTAT